MATKGRRKVFEKDCAFLAKIIVHTLSKYTGPDHPNRIISLVWKRRGDYGTTVCKTAYYLENADYRQLHFCKYEQMACWQQI